MPISKSRLLTAALTAIAIFGISASIAAAGNELIISQDVPKKQAEARRAGRRTK